LENLGDAIDLVKKFKKEIKKEKRKERAFNSEIEVFKKRKLLVKYTAKICLSRIMESLKINI